MRELKFRVWGTSFNGVGRQYYYSYDPTQWGQQYVNKAWESARMGNPIEQYTGLKDKNGKEIYEGDIVSEEFEYGGEKTKTIWQVRWCDDECAFELHYVSGFKVDDCSLVADCEEDYGVVGNIHENPELIGGKE